MGRKSELLHLRGFLAFVIAAGCGGGLEADDSADVTRSQGALESLEGDSALAVSGDTATTDGALGVSGASALSTSLSGGATVNVATALAGTSNILEPVLNLAGIAATSHTSGVIDRTNPFFENMGANGRTCESCHDSRAAWTTSAILSTLLFEFTGATHPLFVSLHDTGNRPDAPYTTMSEKRAALTTLLRHGVNRFTTTNHVGIDYDVTAVSDPWGWSTPAAFARFRRAGTNLGFANRIASSTTTGTPNPTVRDQLVGAVNGGTLFHAQGTVPVPEEKRQAAGDFMMGLSFAQIYDYVAGRLDQGGARGGPANLANEPYPVAGGFDLYTAWTDACNDGPGTRSWCSARNRKREQIARGQEIFNSKTFQVSGVAGVNDTNPVLSLTCSSCHRAKNVGSSTAVRFMDIGVADEANRPDFLPLITVTNRDTGAVRKVTDLGRATSTRLWADIGKVRVLGLRGLASRAPYFHAGQAATIRDVLNFYARRFSIPFTSAERADLEAFLLAL